MKILECILAVFRIIGRLSLFLVIFSLRSVFLTNTSIDLLKKCIIHECINLSFYIKRIFMERDYMNMNKLSVSNQQNQANKVFFFRKK